MIALIDEYSYELMNVTGYVEETIENYVSCHCCPKQKNFKN